VQKSVARLAWAVLGAASLAIACNTAELKQGGTPGSSGSGDPSEQPGDDGGATDGGRDPIADLDGGVIPTSSNVTIQVQPTDSGYAVLNAIRGAKKSVHMEMYLLTNNQIISALGTLKAAGVDVKVVLNQNFPPNGGSNTSAYNSLKSKGVDVRWAPAAYQFTHAKSVIIDGEKLLVMTMNLTETSAKDNREYIATDADPQDVADAETIFDGDFNDRATNVNGKLVFSPQNTSKIDARARLKALIDSAKASVDVEVQSLSDAALTDALIAAKKANVNVRVVVAGGPDISDTPAETDAINKLKAAGVPIVAVTTPYIHAKTIVVDGNKAFVGSQNFTPTALFNNREVGVVTDAASEVAKVAAVIAQDFAAGSPP
jgi:phosphatidylserine/phosphatidylglycerophosphate/cardiolipin synthase-like enzyme